MANDTQLRVAIYGGSGYGGSELLRILLFHPNAEVVTVTANEHAGKAVASVHQNLRGLTDLVFDVAPETLDDIDVVFLAMPHGQAASIVPKLPANISVIDLSGDFRLSDADQIKQYYGRDDADTELQSKFVYGLTETNRKAIRAAKLIANPGCFATATLLALAPMLSSGLAAGKIIVDAKTGSSGSGAKPAANTHHPQRSNSFYAYKPFRHQHLPEIEQHLAEIGRVVSGDIVFMTHSLPVSRGIFASCYFELKEEMTTEMLRNIYTDFYKDAFFVRMVETSPDINWVKGTNFCDISVNAAGRNAVVFSAIDNLVKGAAGQAVQNMNIMHGFPENTGLLLTGSNP